MKVQYKIYTVGSINADPEEFIQNYGYGKDIKYPVVLRPLFLEGFEDEDTFDSLPEAETYLEKNLIEEYGNTYTIVKEYSYERRNDIK